MFVLIAQGFCPKQPQLKVIRQDLCKLEFEVCAKRFTRGEEVIESATFVVWNDEAMRLAEKLVPGVELMATGRQETSRYEVEGTPRSRTVYALTDLQFMPRRAPASQQDAGQGQQSNRQGSGGESRSHQAPEKPRQQPSYRSAPQGQQRMPAQAQPRYPQETPQTPPQGPEFDTNIDGFRY